MDGEVMSRTILIVEDNIAIGELLKEVLSQKTPHKVVVVTHALHALDVARTLQPDLCILDYRLPDMTGIELFDRLHIMKELEAVPAIMISANLPEEEIQARGIIGVKKPFRLASVLNALNQIFCHSQGENPTSLPAHTGQGDVG